MQDRLIVGAALGDCVHVAGVVNFLDLAEQLGYATVCLGPAVAVDELLERVEAVDPAVVAVGYRLTPENCRSLLADLHIEWLPFSARTFAEQVLEPLQPPLGETLGEGSRAPRHKFC